MSVLLSRADIDQFPEVFARVASQPSGTKQRRGELLNQLQALCSYNRSYAARVLRQATSGAAANSRHAPGGRRRGSGRKCRYDDTVLDALQRIWAILGFPAGKRLALFLPKLCPSSSATGKSSSCPEPGPSS